MGVEVDGQSAAGGIAFASIVVPTFREAANLELLIPRISEAMANSKRRFEIVIVDDDSQDGTPKVIAALAAQGHPVRLITRVGERGLSSAVIRGFREAQGEILVCMDADLSHPPEAVPRILAMLETPPTDFVIGSRYVSGASTDEHWGVFRWLNSKVATLMARPFTNAKDPMSGFFAFRRSLFVAAQALNPVGYKIGLELIVKCRCREIREIPIHFADRKFGTSKLNLKEQLNYIKHVKRLADFKFGAIAQFLQFCVVGATGMVVDLTLFGLLRHVSVTFEVARALAIGVAMIWNFFFNRMMTFSYARGVAASEVLLQLIRFCLTCLVGALVSWSLCVLLVKRVPPFATHEFLAALAGIVAGTTANFVISRYWVFKRTTPAESSNSADQP